MSGPFDPGRLRHRVLLQQAVTTPDGAGGETVAWQPAASLWASLMPVKDDERGVAGHLAGVLTHRVVLRRRSDISGATRLVHRGRVFRILAVHDPDETLRFQVALCEEETA